MNYKFIIGPLYFFTTQVTAKRMQGFLRSKNNVFINIEVNSKIMLLIYILRPYARVLIHAVCWFRYHYALQWLIAQHDLTYCQFHTASDSNVCA